MPTTNECLVLSWIKCVRIFQNKSFTFYLLAVLQIFFIKLINAQAITNLIIILTDGKFFFRFLRLCLISHFLYCIIHSFLKETNLKETWVEVVENFQVCHIFPNKIFVYWKLEDNAKNILKLFPNRKTHQLDQISD